MKTYFKPGDRAWWTKNRKMNLHEENQALAAALRYLVMEVKKHGKNIGVALQLAENCLNHKDKERNNGTFNT